VRAEDDFTIPQGDPSDFNQQAEQVLNL